MILGPVYLAYTLVYLMFLLLEWNTLPRNLFLRAFVFVPVVWFSWYTVLSWNRPFEKVHWLIVLCIPVMACVMLVRHFKRRSERAR